MVGNFFRAAYYRKRAAEMLKHARLTQSEEVRSTFLTLARNWEVLAEQVEQKHFAKA